MSQRHTKINDLKDPDAWLILTLNSIESLDDYMRNFLKILLCNKLFYFKTKLMSEDKDYLKDYTVAENQDELAFLSKINYNK